jgi:hypothetical protein
MLNECNFFGYYIASGKKYDVLFKKAEKEIRDLVLKAVDDV